MRLPLFLILTLIFLSVIVILLIPRKKKTIVSRSSSSKAKVAKQSHIVPESTSGQLQNEEEKQYSHAVNSQPVIPKITYYQMDKETYPSQLEDIDEKKRESFNRKIALLKPIPMASSKLFELLKNPNTSTKELTAIIKTNPFLSARILRVINSAYYNLALEVTSVGRAIILLGYNTVRSMTLQDSLHSTLSREKATNKDIFDALWIHSTVVSACANYLNLSVLRSTEDEVGTIGVLHDIGKYFFDLFDTIEENFTEGPTVIQEEKQYGINHMMIGSLLVKKWMLSEIIEKCIEFHHHPIFFPPESIPEPYQKPSFIICLADLICKVLGYSGGHNGEILPIRKEYFELFGLSTEIEKIVTQPLIQEIEKARVAVEAFINTS
jgi:HD-like signal output (HDOD) protein